MRIFAILLVVILLFSCKEDISKDIPESGIQHLVFLNLKDDLKPSDLDQFQETLLKIGTIKGVIDMRIDNRQDVGDTRAIDYDILLQVWLKDEQALKIYDKDSLHNQIRSELKGFLAAPPATFDMVIEDQD